MHDCGMKWQGLKTAGETGDETWREISPPFVSHRQMETARRPRLRHPADRRLEAMVRSPGHAEGPTVTGTIAKGHQAKNGSGRTMLKGMTSEPAPANA